MIRIEKRHFEQDEWYGIVSGMEGLNLMQTWEFSKAKEILGPWKVSRVLFWKDNELIGAAQFLIRYIPLIKRGLVWCNRGPLIVGKIGFEDSVYIEMLKELKKYWVNHKKMYFRLAVPLLASSVSDKSVMDAFYSPATENDGWASEIVDLSCSIEELRKGLKQKWRNCLNKAERLEVNCEIGSSAELMDELLGDYKRLVEQKGFETGVTSELIKSIQELLPDDRKMLVFSGRQNEKRLGSVLIASYGKTCIYLVGATNSEGKKMNANYYLLWNAMCEMKKRGYQQFDVWGAHPENTPRGILHFKRGLNGKRYQLMGEVEAYQDSLVNHMIKKRIETTRQ